MLRAKAEALATCPCTRYLLRALGPSPNEMTYAVTFHIFSILHQLLPHLYHLHVTSGDTPPSAAFPGFPEDGLGRVLGSDLTDRNSTEQLACLPCSVCTCIQHTVRRLRHTDRRLRHITSAHTPHTSLRNFSTEATTQETRTTIRASAGEGGHTTGQSTCTPTPHRHRQHPRRGATPPQ